MHGEQVAQLSDRVEQAMILSQGGGWAEAAEIGRRLAGGSESSSVPLKGSWRELATRGRSCQPRYCALPQLASNPLTCRSVYATVSP